MPDYEKLLLNQVAKTGQINTLMAEGIREDHFDDEKLQEIYRFLADHYRKYKIAPTFDTVFEEFPEHNFEITGESVQFLKDKFKQQVKRRFATESLYQIAEELDKTEADPDELFLEHSRRLATVLPSAKLHSFKDMDKRIAQYLQGEAWDKGIKSGIPEIDKITFGVQPHEYITVFGVTSAGKSTLSQWMLFNAWMQNKTPMYISLEMEANALYRKWDTMLMQFRYNDLKGQTLREEEVEAWKNKAEEVKSKPNDIIVMDDVRGCSVDRVYAELVRWKPDILCIDYVNLMGAPRFSQTWEKITYLTQELKQVSRTLQIPIIGVAQANRAAFSEGARLDNIGGSISAVQDADLVFGLHADEEMREEKKMELRLLKNRDGMLGNVHLWWEPERMKFGPWSETNYLRSRVEESKYFTGEPVSEERGNNPERYG